MLETFRDRVSDESHVSLITEMFKVMYDTDQEDALAKMVANIQKRRPKKVSPYGFLSRIDFHQLIKKLLS